MVKLNVELRASASELKTGEEEKKQLKANEDVEHISYFKEGEEENTVCFPVS